MEVDTTEDLHGIVLNSAFKSMISNPSKLLVSTGDGIELSLNRNVLVLFSPLVRNILSSVPCCTVPTIYLPDINTQTIIKLRDILNIGNSGDFWDVREGGDILEAASALGIDITRLHYGAGGQVNRSSGEMLVDIDKIGNKSRQMKKVFDQKKTEGKEIVLISRSQYGANLITTGNSTRKDIDSRTSAPSISTVEKAPMLQSENIPANIPSTRPIPIPTSTSSVPPPSTIQIKKEAQPVEEEVPNEDSEEPMLPTVTPPGQQSSSTITTSMAKDTEDLKNQCEKCKKAFASMTLLRYHYCSHFRSILKKRFANLFEDNKCLECMKTFPNPGRLLLHIGVHHDKINEILKSKGIAELPPYSATAAGSGGLDPQTEAAVAQQSSEVGKDDDMDTDSSAQFTRDVKNIPLLSAQSAANVFDKPPAAEQGSSRIFMPTSSSSISLSETSLTTSHSDPAASNQDSSFDKNNDSTSECNYELECQVCDQKLKTISLLEQHCCRHFMKDLQDQYSSLMDGLKCNICYSSFKQKHSLLLHIGCKHGKINEILRKKNYAALPCPVTTNTSAAMQKQLVQIKKEKMEVDTKEDYVNGARIRSEMAKEELSDERSAELLNETPPAPAVEDPTAPMPTLDEILKKYKFSTGSSTITK